MIPWYRAGALMVLALAVAGLREARSEVVELPFMEGVDIPTADVMDPATYLTDFRFYSDGGTLSRLMISPFKRIGLGVQFDVQNMIGGGEPSMVSPDLWFKLRAFDGTDYIPAVALGYDSQGYLYQKSTKEFLHEERGLYLVGSHEIFLPNFDLNAGINVPDVDNDAKIYGFFGASWRIIPSFALVAEYDHIRNGPDNRFNMGGRFFVIPQFSVDLAARNIGRGSDRGAERIIRLSYTGAFPSFKGR